MNGAMRLDREDGMPAQRLCLLLGMMTAIAASAGAQTPSPVVQQIASNPKLTEMFKSVWWHSSLPSFEPLPTGPRPVTNRSRTPQGFSNYGQLVGTNPVLQPWAAEVVKKKGELSLAGVVYPNPANQCWPEPMPFLYKNFGIQLLPRGDEITILYDQDHEFRKIRMNQPHAARPRPSFYGDPVGHFEGDTWMVDTVGVRTDHPFAMIDLFGTPYTDKLHIVERFKVISYDEAKDGLDRDAKENFRPPAFINRNFRGNHLQVYMTIDDPGVFTTPWSVTVTYGRGADQLPETVCSENIQEYFENKSADVPTAAKPDF
jgi:hypothetical protein